MHVDDISYVVQQAANPPNEHKECSSYHFELWQPIQTCVPAVLFDIERFIARVPSFLQGYADVAHIQLAELPS